MQCRWAVSAAILIVGLSSCDRRRDTSAPAAPQATTPAPTDIARPAPAETASAGAPTATTPPDATPTADEAPAFAQVYPGAKIEGDPVTAGGAAGPGGLVTFTTPAEPEQVVAFYRDHAEAAGLASVMAMTQGDSRAYGALSQATGATVQVVATGIEDAPTSVQLTWSAGQ